MTLVGCGGDLATQTSDNPIATVEGKPQPPPSPSLPAGYTIAFMRPDNHDVWQICVMTGSKVTQITATGRNTENAHPTWSPPAVTGGPYICFRSVRDGHTGLYRMKPDGSGVTQLTEGPDRLPDWSPDGGRIAFIRDSGDGVTTHLMVLDLANGNATTEIALQTPQGSGHLYWPTFSPDDGSTIAFSLTYGGAGTPGGIYTVPATGGPLTTVLTFPDPNYSEAVDWCRTRIAGGHSLIAVGNDGISTVEMDETNTPIAGSLQTVYSGGPGLGAPTWSWDGLYLGAHTTRTVTPVQYYLTANGTGATSLGTGGLATWKP